MKFIKNRLGVIAFLIFMLAPIIYAAVLDFNAKRHAETICAEAVKINNKSMIINYFKEKAIKEIYTRGLKYTEDKEGYGIASKEIIYGYLEGNNRAYFSYRGFVFTTYDCVIDFEHDVVAASQVVLFD
ncbi:hypothetical protein VQ643_09930 [Pseudomonas sp. F1_0610]|uniref:hypothetical protein n=1 Tax=Pseudomonas sp. F1_0610 TaxID=3114284 RepID=UPI0039C1365A